MLFGDFVVQEWAHINQFLLAVPEEVQGHSVEVHCLYVQVVENQRRVFPSEEIDSELGEDWDPFDVEELFEAVVVVFVVNLDDFPFDLRDVFDF